MSRTLQIANTVGDHWTPKEIKTRLREAALTLEYLSGVGGPKEYGSNWPDVVRQSWDALWEMDALMRWRMRNVKCAPSPPTAKEISQMDETLVWLSLICGETTRRVVWARACGVRWVDLEQKFGKTRQWLYLLHCAGLKAIATSLNGGGPKPGEFSS